MVILVRRVRWDDYLAGNRSSPLSKLVKRVRPSRGSTSNSQYGVSYTVPGHPGLYKA